MLVHCHAGCTPERIVGALGITLRDLMPDRGQRITSISQAARPAIVAQYDYRDASGALLYQVVRFDPKGFKQRRPDPTQPGGWSWNLQGVARLPYKLPELIEAIALERTVYVVEGEKDADALAAIGLTATTNAGGAGKWLDRYGPHFRGAHVVILPDNDQPGQRHAAQVATSLQGVAASVRIVELPNLAPKGDVFDWLAQGGTAQDLEALVAARPNAAPSGGAVGVVSSAVRTRWTLREMLADAELMRPPVWIAPRVAAASRSTLFVAAEKAGKSTFSAYVAARVSTGSPMLGVRATAGTVLIFGLEEFAGDVARRLQQFGADVDRTHFVAQLTALDVGGRLAEIQSHIEAVCPVLVVVDTLLAFAAGAVESTNQDAEMQPVVQGLSLLAHQGGFAMVIAHHARRSDGKFRGSGAIAGGVDIILTMSEVDDAATPTVRQFTAVGRVPVSNFRVAFTGSGFELLADETADLAARVSDAVAVTPGLSKKALREMVGGKAGAVDEALVWLVKAGRIVNRGSDDRHEYYLSEDARGEVRPPHPPCPSGTRWGHGAGHADVLPGEALLSDPPCPAGTRSGHGADDLRDTGVVSHGQRRVTRRNEPPKGVHPVTPAPNAAMAGASQ